jgi:hypothetical protein
MMLAQVKNCNAEGLHDSQAMKLRSTNINPTKISIQGWL